MGSGNDSLRTGVESRVDLVTGCICHESVGCHRLRQWLSVEVGEGER